MYSDKENVNILTSLLIAHGVRHAVVCPGSRNAPITHNLCECPDIDCVSVTDERSAAFIALGMAQALSSVNIGESRKEPVAVCVTSGTALLNTLPGVAEAYYQHIPLIVISADRPAAMIGQLQGQTLPQPGALGRFVKKAVTLPEVSSRSGECSEESLEHWHCNRLVNEALIAMQKGGGGPVHINVPLSEPLFNFTVASLPEERVVRFHSVVGVPCARQHTFIPGGGDKPMLVIGQLPYHVAKKCEASLTKLREHFVVLQEQLSDDSGSQCHFDEALSVIGDNPDYQPDLVIYIGDTLVSKRIKRFLQSFTPKRTIVVNETGELTDVTMHATDVIASDAECFISALSDAVDKGCWSAPFYERWKGILDKCQKYCDDFQPAYSQMLTVKQFHEIVNKQDCYLQYGNSSAIRLGIIYSTHYIYVNRGVNGIEGSLSTAVGFNSVADKPTYCVIGDLSFFYDQNALWNNLDKRNLRILLLNNGSGGIFHQLPGLEKSPWRDGFVAAAHVTKAKGICEETGVDYRQVWSPDELSEGLAWLTDEGTLAPRLLEVFTDPDKDTVEVKRYSVVAVPCAGKHKAI